ncbi:MAG: radical SAM protein, partial [Pseudomonadota bacterium]|nr:radical SAM protein [Pseudomonadota bacterium]
MRDAHGRTIDYIRLSVTDRCNLRCTYCMAEDMQFLPRRDLLTFEEIETLCAHLVTRGVRRIRLTGGEPLVRKGIVDLVQRIAALSAHGLEEVTLTTNGTRLPEMANDLAEAGIRRVN